MTHHWIAATLIGFCLGLALYGCVRLRIFLGPRLRDRYGNVARQAFWILTIVVMVALANAALRGLRMYLNDPAPPANNLLLEIWFSALALMVGMGLLLKRMRRSRRN